VVSRHVVQLVHDVPGVVIGTVVAHVRSVEGLLDTTASHARSMGRVVNRRASVSMAGLPPMFEVGCPLMRRVRLRGS
jgi:hypothetical protein